MLKPSTTQAALAEDAIEAALQHDKLETHEKETLQAFQRALLRYRLADTNEKPTASINR